jgi:hypothetical protein
MRVLSRKIPRPPKPPRGYGNTTTIREVRSYEVPGGPVAAYTSEADIKTLAEFERGGDEDMNAGR